MIAGVAETFAAVKSAPSRALGLDPGETTGWGVVEVQPPDRIISSISSRERLVAFGVLDQSAPGAHLRELLREHHPELVGVEVIERVHPVKRRGFNGISTVQALALYRTGRRAERLIGVVERAGIRIVELTSERVREGIAGSQTASDAEVEQALRLRLADFPPPRKSNNHERDGIAAGLLALLEARLRAGVRP